MADIEVSIGSVAEIPKGLDKVRDALATAVSSGMDAGIQSMASKIQAAIEQLDAKPRPKSATKEAQYHEEAASAIIDALAATKVTKENLTSYKKGVSVLRTIASSAQSGGKERGDLGLYLLGLETREEANALTRSATEQIAAQEKALKQGAALERYNAMRPQLAGSIRDLHSRLLQGDISKDDYISARNQIQRQQRYAITDATTAGIEVKELRRLNDNFAKTNENLERLAKKQGILGKEGDSLLGSTLGRFMTFGAGVALANFSGNIANYFAKEYKAFYANRENPFSNRREQRAEEVQKIGASVSKWVGGILAGVGLVAAPVTGGASLALTAGGAALAAGGTWGAGFRERQIAAATSSQQDAIEQRRWRALYGERTNGWQFAKFVGKTGFATEGDVETMMANANTFNAAAAFGGVSSSQYMALAMMPNYYNAMVSGASESEMLQAYQADMQALGPGMGAYFSQMAGVPENMRALVNSGTLGYALNDLGTAARLEAKLGQHENAYILAHYTKGREDVTARERAWNVGATSFSKYDYAGNPQLSELGVSLLTTLDSLNVREWKNGRAEPSDRLTKRDIIININTDEAIRLNGVYTDDQILDAYIQYSAGSIA